MNGQWLGTFSNSEGGGSILVNIDERETYLPRSSLHASRQHRLTERGGIFQNPKPQGCEV
jgi:hypothetical protein